MLKNKTKVVKDLNLNSIPNLFIKQLRSKINSKAGRGSYGRITVRHRRSGSKKLFYVIDFHRRLIDVAGKILHVVRDPVRSGYIGLVFYKDVGIFSYVLLPRGVLAGYDINCHIVLKFLKTQVPSKTKAASVSIKKKDIPLGFGFPVCVLPVSVPIYNVEMKPGSGGQLARAAGVSASVVRRFEKHLVAGTSFVGVRLPSGKFLFISSWCFASVGSVSNPKHHLREDGKAGRAFYGGNRSSVRGVAMNPIDHPHGGGEGKTSGGRPSVSPWGWLTKGGRTRTLKKIRYEVKLYKKIKYGKKTRSKIVY